MPHLTAQCLLTLDDEEPMVVGSVHEAISATVTLLGEQPSTLATGKTVFPPPLLAPVPSARVAVILLEPNALAVAPMTALVRSIRLRSSSITGVPDMGSVYLLNQSPRKTAAGSVLAVSLLFTARGQRPVTAEAVRERLPALVEVITVAGYRVDEDSTIVSDLTVDAMIAYRCGGGPLCLPGDACSWDSDCLGGYCEDSHCVDRGHSSQDSTWMYIAGGVAAALAVAFVVVLMLWRERRLTRHVMLEELIHKDVELLPPRENSSAVAGVSRGVGNRL
jgi:hypothetical protein